MRQTTFCLLVGLIVQNGAAAFAPREHSGAPVSMLQRYMSDPGAGGQQQQPMQQQQQVYDQNGNPVPAWNTAVDPASGNTYWYNVFTGETSWNPPGAPPPPPPPPQPAQPQQQQQRRALVGGGGSRRNPDADRVVNKADVYLAMLKQDSTTRTMARHYGDIDASNEVFTDPEIENIKNMVIDNPYLEKEKELIETSAEEMLPIVMLNAEEEAKKQIPEQAKKGPNYKDRLAQMKNKRQGGGSQ